MEKLKDVIDKKNDHLRGKNIERIYGTIKAKGLEKKNNITIKNIVTVK